MPCVNVLMQNIVATLIIQLLINNVRKLVFSFGL